MVTGEKSVIYRADQPERASEGQIREYVAKLGPGLYHRLSGCTPPPAWGFGSPADLAAAHLVKIGPPAIPFVLPLRHTQNPATRALVIEILSRIGGGEVVPALIDTYQHDDSDQVRLSAAEGLSWNHDPRTAPAMVPALRDPDRQVEMFAVRTLCRQPQRDALEPLAELMGHASESMPMIGPYTPPSMVAESAAYALGAIGPPAFNRILELLASPNKDVHRVAAIALSECNDRLAIPKLIELCSDPEDMTRMRAAQALGRWPGRQSVETLTKLMYKGGANSCGMAAQSLARIGGEALDPLFEAARGKDPALREMAANSFMELSDRRESGRLVDVMNSSDQQVRQQALFKLSMWSDPRALPTILQMTDESDMERRRSAIGMLWNYDDTRHPEIVAPLLKAMTDEHEWVRNQAAGSLFGKHDKRIGPAMKALLKSQLKGVPELAALVLKQYHPR